MKKYIFLSLVVVIFFPLIIKLSRKPEPVVVSLQGFVPELDWDEKERNAVAESKGFGPGGAVSGNEGKVSKELTGSAEK
ncbi:MAG: hypothetical protein MRJ65_02325 [Candidatus Brocadiaceae bacterium]|nr:hypothetical protein [Candidatus Brocadiaceae bacterium]